MKALLALENGQVFEGVAAGATGETSGEVVFNTSLTGYQEVLTDPSYAGQIVTMTAPLIGNYGVSPEDMESRGPQVAGFVMREESRVASNWRSQMTLKEYLTTHGIVAIADIDTRALTRVLRSAGVMRGVIATGAHVKGEELVEKARAVREMSGADLVRDVTCSAPFDWTPGDEPGATVGRDLILEPQRRAGRRLKVAAYDLGMKYNILRRFAEHGVANVPVFGICLGHQVLAQALGAKTFKLKFGHRGTNHPVKHLESGAVEITSQNHGFAVDPETIPADDEVTHVNLYDNTVEG